MFSRNLPAWATILIAGCVGWITIDVFVSADYVVHGASPLRLFQWDASTLLGHAAYAGGLGSATLGALLDLIASIVWAYLAYAAAQRLLITRQHPIIWGTVFGTAVMIVMIFIIVPLSRAKQPHFASPFDVLETLIGHTLFFGIPVVLTTLALSNSKRDNARRAETGAT